jgi:hypothetical protein
MRRLIVAAIASLGVAGFVAMGEAKAQFSPYSPNPYGGPAVSPYLNLLRAGASPAVNYYGLVRPQQAYNYALNSLEQQVTLSRLANTTAESQAAPQTGHQITFLNYRKYFLNTGAVSPFQNVEASGRALASGAVAGGQAAGATPGARSSYGGYGGSAPYRRY